MKRSEEKTSYPVNFEELEDAEDNVVDITEPGGLGLFSMVESTGPIDGDVGVLAVELDGGADGAAGRSLAEAEQAVEDGAVLADVEALEVAGEGRLGEGVGADGGEEVDVVVGVEAADVVGGGGEGAVDLHAAVEGVVHDEVVGHTDAVGLHGVPLTVVVVADARLVEVCHPPLLPVGSTRQRCTTLLFYSHNSLSLSLSLYECLCLMMENGKWKLRSNALCYICLCVCVAVSIFPGAI